MILHCELIPTPAHPHEAEAASTNPNISAGMVTTGSFTGQSLSIQGGEDVNTFCQRISHILIDTSVNTLAYRGERF